MKRHVTRSITSEFDERNDQMPDFDSFVPLLSPPVIFKNGRIISRHTDMERREASKLPVRFRPKRVA